MERTKIMSVRLALAIAGTATALLVAACGGGGGGSSPAPATALATATPTPAANGDGILLSEVAPFGSAQSSSSGSPITQPSPGSVQVNNISIPFTAVGQQQGIAVNEQGFSGTFSFTVVDCTGSPAVTIAPPSGAGPVADFVVTSSQAGFCSVKVSDGTNEASFLVDVTTTSGSISSTKRN